MVLLGYNVLQVPIVERQGYKVTLIGDCPVDALLKHLSIFARPDVIHKKYINKHWVIIMSLTRVGTIKKLVLIDTLHSYQYSLFICKFGR